MNGWLLAFAEIAGLRWVLERRRMAFSRGAASRAARIQVGDELILYLTRGAFHNPTRDKSQLAGIAHVTSPIRQLKTPIEIAGRDFVATCGIDVDLLLPERRGVPFEPLVRRIQFIPRKDVWGQYLRGGLVELPPKDLKTMHQAIAQGAHS